MPERSECPFCGSDGARARPIRDGFRVICGACGAAGPPVFHGPGGPQATVAEAEAMWSGRRRRARCKTGTGTTQGERGQ